MANAPAPPQLVMQRPTLADLPPVLVPPGFTCRHFRPGDAEAWTRIYASAFGIEAPDAFDRIMRTDGPFRPERVWFVCAPDGRPVATASAWRSTRYGPGVGYLHYVGVLATERGRGLGLTATLAALHQMAREGCSRSVLQTDDHRLPAIRQYLRLGYAPLIVDEGQRDRWRAVFEGLGQPELASSFARELAAAPLVPGAEPADKDHAGRYAVRYRWRPNRPHKGGTGGGDMDFMADESLYKPSRLGSATVQPDSVTAGERVEALTLTYTAGEDGVAEGSQIVFEVKGQSPLGFAFFVSADPQPGKLRIRGPAGVELEPYNEFGNGVVLKHGALAAGETVRLELVPGADIRWKPVAGVRQIKVALYAAPGEPGRRLPAPLRLAIEPAAADHVEVLGPASLGAGEPADIRVTVRDRFDNRIPLEGTADIELGDSRASAPLVRGLAGVRIPAAGPVPVQPRASVRGLPLPCRGNVAAPPVDGLRLFVGDLHCHDFLSQAEGWPDAVYRHAIDDKRLDFLVVSPQSHGWHDNETWTVVKYMNERFLDEGRFVTLLGYEWQHTGYGDKVVVHLGGDQPYLPVDDSRSGSAARIYEALRASDAIAICHHSAYPPGSWCSHTRFDAVEDDVERLVELWSMHGSSEGYDPADRPLRTSDPAGTAYAALRRGLRLGFVGGSDSHSGRPGGSAQEPLAYWGGLTALWAPELTRRAVFEALRARRTYALTESRVVLAMQVNGAWMGSELPATDAADISIRVWTPAPIRRVELMKNLAVLKTFGPFGTDCAIEERDRTGGPAAYHCRVTLEDGNLAVCSPVWVGDRLKP